MLETATNDVGVVVSDDGREAFFSRLELADGGPSTTYRIWTARRASGEVEWSNVAPAENLGSVAGNDLATWLSGDRCTLYLASDGDGTNRFYVATRPK